MVVKDLIEDLKRVPWNTLQKPKSNMFLWYRTSSNFSVLCALWISKKTLQCTVLPLFKNKPLNNYLIAYLAKPVDFEVWKKTKGLLDYNEVIVSHSSFIFLSPFFLVIYWGHTVIQALCRNNVIRVVPYKEQRELAGLSFSSNVLISSLISVHFTLKRFWSPQATWTRPQAVPRDTRLMGKGSLPPDSEESFPLAMPSFSEGSTGKRLSQQESDRQIQTCWHDGDKCLKQN